MNIEQDGVFAQLIYENGEFYVQATDKFPYMKHGKVKIGRTQEEAKAAVLDLLIFAQQHYKK